MSIDALGLGVVGGRQVGRAADGRSTSSPLITSSAFSDVLRVPAAGFSALSLLLERDQRRCQRGRNLVRRWRRRIPGALRRRALALVPGFARRLAARADGAPVVEQMSSGTTKGGEGQSSALRAPAISSAPGASLCAFCVPCARRQAEADDGAAGDQHRACRWSAPRSSARDDIGRVMAVAGDRCSSPRPGSARSCRWSRTARSRRRW